MFKCEAVYETRSHTHGVFLYSPSTISIKARHPQGPVPPICKAEILQPQVP